MTTSTTEITNDTINNNTINNNTSIPIHNIKNKNQIIGQTPLAEVNDLHITFKGDKQSNHAIKGLSFRIFKGQSVALVGESGSGKSISARTLMKLHPDNVVYGEQTHVYYNNQSILKYTDRQMEKIRGKEIAMIFQEPMTSLNPIHTIGNQLIEAMLWHNQQTTKVQAVEKAIQMLTLVALPEPETYIDRYPHQLSGGQRQRVMIAMALINDAHLLIADEPTTALDVTVQAEILHLLRSLQREKQMGLLLITHDLTIVQKFADYVYVMHDGVIVEENKTEQLFNNPKHPYTQQLLDSEPKNYAPPFNINEPVILNVVHMNVTFERKVKSTGWFQKKIQKINVVNDISFSLKQGETLGIVGESGSGKTTLVMAIIKLLEAGEISGRVDYDHSKIDHFTRKQMKPMRRKIQVVFQDPFSSLNPRLSVQQILEEGLIVNKIGNNHAQREQLICRSLIDSGLDPAVRGRFPHEFSGGERQRIAIARAIVLNPEFIVLDEPTSALDLTVQKQIIDLLLKLQKDRNLSYLFISHDLRVIRALCHNILVIQHGNFIEYAPTMQLLSNPNHPYTQKLINSAFDLS